MNFERVLVGHLSHRRPGCFAEKKGIGILYDSSGGRLRCRGICIELTVPILMLQGLRWQEPAQNPIKPCLKKEKKRGALKT